LLPLCPCISPCPTAMPSPPFFPISLTSLFRFASVLWISSQTLTVWASPGVLLQVGCWASLPSDSVGEGWGLRTCISDSPGCCCCLCCWFKTTF
jgi:hypothetical protein